MAKLGVLIVGLNGAISTTLIAGVELMVRGLVPKIGMVTEAGEAKVAEDIDQEFDFTPLKDIVFGGWDLKLSSAYDAALHHNVLNASLLEKIRPHLDSLKPWPAVFKPAYAENLTGDHVHHAVSMREEINYLLRSIEDFKKANDVQDIVMVNLASTERYLEVGSVHQTLAAFESGIEQNDPAISPAMRYFYVANKLGIPYCNFAPSLTNVPALQEQAALCKNPYAGMDGKTGQTLVKTTLAPMFRVRRLHVEGWYSVNFLGNNDGLILNSPASNKTKVLSKAAVLDAIVGYHVENHQVHIHYYKPRGDAKEAWDNIDFTGFCGVPMQMKVNFLCQDSVLAAPLVIDMVRLLAEAKRAGEHGIQRQLSVFFKSPYHSPNEQPEHDVFKQERMLLDWCRQHGKSSKKR